MGILPRAVADIYQRIGDKINIHANVHPSGCSKVSIAKASQLDQDNKIKVSTKYSLISFFFGCEFCVLTYLVRPIQPNQGYDQI